MPLIVAQQEALLPVLAAGDGNGAGTSIAEAAPAATVAAAAAPTVTAAAAEKRDADDLYRFGAFVLVVAGAFLGWGLYSWLDPAPFTAAAGISLFAPMYILAQAIERLMEPFTSGLGKTTDTENTVTEKKDKQRNKVTKKEAQAARDKALATLLRTGDTADFTPGKTPSETAAAAQSLVDVIRRNKAFASWGIASALAMAACGAFGVRLLAVAGFDVPAFWDIAITGLAVGSGTKPLHDLISNIQKSKTEKEDPPAVATAD